MSNVKFATVAEAKEQLGIQKLDIVRNPNTSKLFAQDQSGNNYRVQGNIDKSKPMAWITEEGKPLSEGCLINVEKDASANVQFSL